MKQILLTMFTALMMSLSCANVQGQTFSKMPEKQRNAALIKAAKEFYKNPAFKNHRKTWPSVGETSIRQFYTQDSVSRMTAYHNIGTLQYEVIFWRKQKVPNSVQQQQKNGYLISSARHITANSPTTSSGPSGTSIS